MELRHLDYFVAVAEERHFTRAARRLHIAQSGLSAAIRALERELGAALFVRNTRRVELTEAGRVLLIEARRTLTAAQGAHDAVASVQGLVRGTLSVGMNLLLQSPTRHMDLPALLRRFHCDYPGVQIRLRQAPGAELLAEVRVGKLDLAFVGLVEQSTAGLTAHLLSRDSLVLACSPTHRLASREQVTLADLADEAFIDFQPEGALRQYVDRAFASAHLKRRTTFEVENLIPALDLVAHGLGVTVVPYYCVVYATPVRYVPLKPVAAVDFVVVTADDPPTSVSARAMLAMVLSQEAPTS